MKVILLDRGFNLDQIQRAIGFAINRLRLNRTEHRRTATLIFVCMRLLANDVFVATCAMCHQTEQVAHGASGYEQRRLEAQLGRQVLFQTINRRVFAIHVITQLGGLHGLTHTRGRLGDGVAAQVDSGHSGLSLNRAKARC